MRENRTYGSEGGESGQPDFPTPIVECPERWQFGNALVPKPSFSSRELNACLAAHHDRPLILA